MCSGQSSASPARNPGMSVIRKAAAFRTNRVAGCSWHQRDTAWCNTWLGIYHSVYFGIPGLSDSPVWATLDRPWVHRQPNLTTEPDVSTPEGSEHNSSGLWAGVSPCLRAQARASVATARHWIRMSWKDPCVPTPSWPLLCPIE